MSPTPIAAMGIKILGPNNARELDELIAIYRSAIEPSEQKTAAEIAAMIADPRYVLMVAQDQQRVTGFSITIFPSGADFFLLEYMAVDGSARGRRIGEALFLAAYEFGSTRGPQTMVLEVDQPGTSGNPENDTEARYRFYRRMGCRRVANLNYALPLETAGAPPPMMLLTYQVPSVVTVSRSRLEAWLRTIYVTVYGKAVDDPRIEKMMSQTTETTVAVPL